VDRRLEQLLLAEIDSQCGLVLVANEHLDAAEHMEMRPEVSRIEYFWSAVQGIVLAAGNLRNLLWSGIGGRGTKAQQLREAQTADRAVMRQTLGVEDTSPLRSVALRNSLEHFDERITDWYTETPVGNYQTRGIVSHIGRVDVASNTAHFGLYERSSGDVFFQGDKANMHEIVEECRRIQPRAEEEMIRLIRLDMHEAAAREGRKLQQ
jgi:hypothetical protein